MDFELFNTRTSFQSLNLAELVGKNGMEIGWKLEEKSQKVNLNVLRETTNGYLF